jgi:hypothetical protein
MNVDEILLPHPPRKARAQSSSHAQRFLNKIFTRVTEPDKKPINRNIDKLLQELAEGYRKEQDERFAHFNGMVPRHFMSN